MKPFCMRTFVKVLAVAILWAAFTASADSRDSPSSIQLEVNLSQLRVTPRTGQYHIFRAQTPRGRVAPLMGPLPLDESLTDGAAPGMLPLTSLPSVPPPHGPSFYPGDVEKVFASGNTLARTVFNPIYINCSSGGSCWGDPTAFQSDLAQSQFIHLTDQYTNGPASFSLGTIANTQVNFTGVDDCGIGSSNPCLSDTDVEALVNVVANQLGAGYGHLYNVFLPKGIDVCLTDRAGNLTGQCYSPDVPDNWVLCGYHSSGDESAGHVVYTVEPFDGVDGCETAPPHVNGVLADSTDDLLAHEIFEAITDPDVPFSFVDLKSLPLFFDEIADICQALVLNRSFEPVGFYAAALTLNGQRYKSQLMYSNHYHACSSTP